MNDSNKIAHAIVGLCVSLIVACSSDFDGYAYMPDEVPSGRCNTDEHADDPDCAETTGTSGTATDSEGSAGTPCEDGAECADGLVCSAPFTNGERGKFACVEICIGHMDELRWCADARACCHPNAVCTARGYCLEPDSDTDTGTDTDSGTGTGTDTDSGTD